MATLVLTVIGDDRPGLVSALSAPLQEHGASWDHSRMARLAGKFAGIVEVTVPDGVREDLVAALRDIEGLTVTVAGASEPTVGPATTLVLGLLGQDRPGIVSEVSTLLAQHGVSIEELETEVRDAPMAGGLLFEARAVLGADPATDVAALRGALEALADELMVDAELADVDEMADEA